MNKKILIIGICLLVVDFISKMIISSLMSIDESIKVIKNFLYITYVRNEGVAFSFLEGSLIFIILMSFIAIFFIIYYISHKKISKLESVGFGLILGGAFGNLIDRVFYGYVIDFIDVYIFGYDYPIFNVADIGVVVGVFVIIINSFIEDRRK